MNGRPKTGKTHVPPREDNHELHESHECSPSVSRTRRLFRITLRVFRRLSAALIAFILLYMAAVWILGRVPVNTGFQHAGQDGIEICVAENGVHADLIIPLDAGNPSLRSLLPKEAFQIDPSEFNFGIVGWGNRKFYLETETWNDLRLSTTLQSLSGLGATTLHVGLHNSNDFAQTSSRLIRVTEPQFQSLLNHITGSLQLNEQGEAIPIQGAHYNRFDAFFEGKGRYHLFRTCNVWVGRGLQKGGVRVGIWTVTPKALFASLPSDVREGR